MLPPLAPLLVAAALAVAPPVHAAPAAPSPVATAPREAAPSESAWQAVLDRAATGIVAIRISQPRAFDTEGAANGVATGFVVDAERGIVLTNRHVVSPGPVVAEAVFLNNEEVPLRAIYRDPVHDFGLFQYDPAKLRFMKPAELALEPAHARVGTDIRVVGNDAGEKISILGGTLARLDRDAPEYGKGKYNDFNTFYFQAASGTSGGSSGSPVLDPHGHVIALNAGGSTRAASSFFLPLDRVVRALQLVREGQPVPRGTLQTVFSYVAYDEARRLGLREGTEAATRAAFPEGTGMLVVEQVIPGGPAFDQLQPGDVLVKVGGAPVTGFVPLEAALDAAVGGTLALELERGGTSVAVEVPVQDLHAVTPDRYLEVGGGIVHALSLQQARNYGVPAGQAYVAFPGHVLSEAGVPQGAVITAVGATPIRSTEALEAALAALPDGAAVPIRFVDVRDARRERVAAIRMDRRWFPMQNCMRDDATGTWLCTPSAPPPARVSAAAAVAEAVAAAPNLEAVPRGAASRAPSRVLAPSLVWIDFAVPYRAEGVYGTRFRGTGVVVDAEQGLVLTDRDTAPIAMGDATLTFGGTVEIPATVRYLHPVHNLAVLQYDPAALAAAGGAARAATFSDAPLVAGDDVWQMGLGARQQLVAHKSAVKRVAPVLLKVPTPPFFRQTNLDAVLLGDAGEAVGGVLADAQGRVQALWASFVQDGGEQPNAFFAGLPAAEAVPIVDALRAGKNPEVRTIAAELTPIGLSEARDRGLSPASQAALSAGPRREALEVARIVAGTPTERVLREGDVLVAIGGKPATSYAVVEAAVAASPTDRVTARVLRDGTEQDLDVPVTAFPGDGVDRAVLWAGALLHAPHSPIAAQRGVAPEGVYVAWSWFGAPAPRYGLRPTWRITAVDDTTVSDLDAFLRAVADKRDGDTVRLKTVDLDGKTRVITLALDLRYWPTAEIARGAQGWARVDVPGPSLAEGTPAR